MIILRAIESATNCYNEMNQIDEYLEYNSFDSIKTILPFAARNFHEMVRIRGYDMPKYITQFNNSSSFLEKFSNILSQKIIHRNKDRQTIQLNAEEYAFIIENIQKVKTFAITYKNILLSKSIEI